MRHTETKNPDELENVRADGATPLNKISKQPVRGVQRMAREFKKKHDQPDGKESTGEITK